MRRLFTLAGLFFVGLLSMALVASPAHASSYTLTAHGTWVSNDGLLNGTWDAHFDVAGFDLSGTLNVLGMPGVGSGNIAGAWDLDHLGFGVMFLDKEVAAFTGGLQDGQLGGTFDSGSITGDWTGSLGSLSFTNQPITAITNATIPTLLLSNVGGKLGDLVSLAASLDTLGAPITKVENIINFDNFTTPIAALVNGAPDCVVNPLLKKADTLFEFLPHGCTGLACTQVRAVVQSLTNSDPIPDGATLYTCRVRILTGAATGIYHVFASALKAIDINSIPLPLAAVGGEITAKAATLTQQVKDGCNCAIAAEAGHVPLLSLLAPLLLIALRRREQRRSSAR